MNNLLVNAVVHTGQFTSVTLPSGVIWSTLIISLVITLAFYLLRSFGLYILAKNQKVDKAFLAFIPGVWIYIACKIIGKARIFGKTFEQIAIWIAIIFTISEVLTLVYNIMIYVPLAKYVFVLDKTVHVADGEVVATNLKRYLEIPDVLMLPYFVEKAYYPYGDSFFIVSYFFIIYTKIKFLKVRFFYEINRKNRYDQWLHYEACATLCTSYLCGQHTATAL